MKNQHRVIAFTIFVFLFFGNMAYSLAWGEGRDVSFQGLNPGEKFYRTSGCTGCYRDLNMEPLIEFGGKVIVNNVEWAELWDRMNCCCPTVKRPLPRINFDKEMVIAVFMGMQRTTGYGIQIDKIVDTGEKLVVSIKEIYPSMGSVVGDALTSPACLVKLEKTDKQVLFKIVKENSFKEMPYLQPPLKKEKPKSHLDEIFLQSGLFRGDIEMVSKALDNGVDVNIRYESGETPLMIAAGVGQKDIVELLLSKGADVNAKGGIFGRTALMNAALNCYKEIAELLLAQGADVNVRNNNGGTALSLCFQSGPPCKELIKLFLLNGADVNSKDNSGSTVLMSAAASGDSELVREFLDRGMDVNAKTNYGWTALMSAASKGNKEAAQLLLSRGADTNAVDNEGRTALSVAKSKNHREVVPLLKNFGAKK